MTRKGRKLKIPKAILNTVPSPQTVKRSVTNAANRHRNWSGLNLRSVPADTRMTRTRNVIQNRIKLATIQLTNLKKHKAKDKVIAYGRGIQAGLRYSSLLLAPPTRGKLIPIGKRPRTMRRGRRGRLQK